MKRIAASTALVLAFGTVLALVPPTKAQAEHRSCSNATLRGGFGYTATGTLIGAPAPFAGPFGEVGRATFDGDGNTSGTATLSANANIVNITFTGTYTVNPDCTGSMTLNVSPLGITGTSFFVIDDDGLEIRTISADQGIAVETRVYRKQFQRGDQGQ